MSYKIRLYFVYIYNFQAYQISKLIFKTNYEIVLSKYINFRHGVILGTPPSKKIFRYNMKDPIMSRLLFYPI